jgi:hypothetical protein
MVNAMPRNINDGVALELGHAAAEAPSAQRRRAEDDHAANIAATISR